MIHLFKKYITWDGAGTPTEEKGKGQRQIIHLVDGVDALFFSTIYLLTILYCSLNLPTALNFLMATLASLLYSGLISAEYFGLIPHHSTY